MIDEHIVPGNWGILPEISFLGLKLHTYTIFMILAFIGAFICYKLTAQKKSKTDASNRILIIVYALLGGVIGAKLPILIMNYRSLFHYPENIQLLLSGKTIIGGLIGGTLSVFLTKKFFGIKMKTGNDIAAPAALGMAIGRLGCFFTGCCYGIPSPEFMGVDFGDGIKRYPTQLYEMVFDLILFTLFLYLKGKYELKPGILFKYLLNSYFTFRFLIEFIRESDKNILFLSIYQILCIVCIIFINRNYIMKLLSKFRRVDIYE